LSDAARATAAARSGLIPPATKALAMQESHVLVGWNVARKLRLSVLKMQRILAIELLAAAWRSGLFAFLDLHEPNCLDQ